MNFTWQQQMREMAYRKEKYGPCPYERPWSPPPPPPPQPTAQDRIASALERIADALETAQNRPPSRGVSLN